MSDTLVLLLIGTLGLLVVLSVVLLVVMFRRMPGAGDSLPQTLLTNFQAVLGDLGTRVGQLSGDVQSVARGQDTVRSELAQTREQGPAAVQQTAETLTQRIPEAQQALTSVTELVHRGLQRIPPDSRTAAVITDMLDWYKYDLADGAPDWRATVVPARRRSTPSQCRRPPTRHRRTQSSSSSTSTFANCTHLSDSMSAPVTGSEPRERAPLCAARLYTRGSRTGAYQRVPPRYAPFAGCQRVPTRGSPALTIAP